MMPFRLTLLMPLLLMTSLAACCGSRVESEEPKPPEIRYLPGRTTFCVRTKARPEPELLPCPHPEDWSPGSCGRINNSRLLDHYEHLLRYAALVAALCELDKPTVVPP